VNWSTKIPREPGVYWRELNPTQRPMLTSVLHFDDRRGVARVVDMEDGCEYEFSDGSHRWCPIASPAAGKWRQSSPDFAGAYWIKDRSGALQIVFVLDKCGATVKTRRTNGERCDFADAFGDWQAIDAPQPNDSDDFAEQARASWRIQFRDGRVFVVSERAGRGLDEPARWASIAIGSGEIDAGGATADEARARLLDTILIVIADGPLFTRGVARLLAPGEPA
jgi:hypothetical protein